VKPIRKGPGGLPRILSLAAETAKQWYYRPQTCSAMYIKGQRQTRSERREAYQVVIETMLSFMDITTMRLGVPTASSGFIYVDMKTLIKASGLKKKRFERAVADLQDAGFVVIKRRYVKTDEGKYSALRASKQIKIKLFKCLRLDRILKNERKRSASKLYEEARETGRKVSDLLLAKRPRPKKKGKQIALPQGSSDSSRTQATWGSLPREQSAQEKQMQADLVREWNSICMSYISVEGMPLEEARRRTNESMGLHPEFRPGIKGLPGAGGLFTAYKQ
jgi:hypothetical protein